MTKSDLIRLRHILDAIKNIETFVAGMSVDTFIQDLKTVKAVVCELENIGEAMNNVSNEFRAAHLDIPYAKIIGMRHILIHEYFGASEKVVWETIQEDLPQLKE